jgi:hypothetical protein
MKSKPFLFIALSVFVLLNISLAQENKDCKTAVNKYELTNSFQYYFDSYNRRFSYKKKLNNDHFLRLNSFYTSRDDKDEGNYNLSEAENDIINHSKVSEDYDWSSLQFGVSLQYLLPIYETKYLSLVGGIGPAFILNKRDNKYNEKNYGAYIDKYDSTEKSYGIVGSIIFETNISKRIGLFGEYEFQYLKSSYKRNSYYSYYSGVYGSIVYSVESEGTGAGKTFEVSGLLIGAFVQF